MESISIKKEFEGIIEEIGLVGRITVTRGVSVDVLRACGGFDLVAPEITSEFFPTNGGSKEAQEVFLASLQHPGHPVMLEDIPGMLKAHGMESDDIHALFAVRLHRMDVMGRAIAALKSTVTVRGALHFPFMEVVARPVDERHSLLLYGHRHVDSRFRLICRMA